MLLISLAPSAHSTDQPSLLRRLVFTVSWSSVARIVASRATLITSFLSDSCCNSPPSLHISFFDVSFSRVAHISVDSPSSSLLRCVVFSGQLRLLHLPFVVSPHRHMSYSRLVASLLNSYSPCNSESRLKRKVPET